MVSGRFSKLSIGVVLGAAAVLAVWFSMSWMRSDPAAPSKGSAAGAEAPYARSAVSLAATPSTVEGASDRSSGTLRLTVVDESGEPIVGAQMSESGGPQPPNATSGADGLIRWPESRVPADCQVRHPSYFDALHRVEADGETIVLRRLPSVSVRCVGADGNLVEGLSLRLNGAARDPEELAPPRTDRQGRIVWFDQRPGIYSIGLADGPWVPMSWDGASQSGRFELGEDSLSVTVTVAKASAVIVQIIGDHPVLHYFAISMTSTSQTPGLAGVIERIDQQLRAAYPEAMTRVWAAPAGVEDVELIVYCQNSGWHHVRVPVRAYEPGISPQLVTIEAGPTPLTAAIKRIDGTGAKLLPLVAVLSNQEHGCIQVLLDEDVKQVPCGQYRLQVHHPHLGDHARFSPIELDLERPGAIVAVDVSVDRPIRRADLEVVRPDGTPWSGFLYARDASGNRMVSEYVINGVGTGLLIPADVELHWQCADGKGAKFEAVTPPLEFEGGDAKTKIALSEVRR